MIWALVLNRSVWPIFICTKGGRGIMDGFKKNHTATCAADRRD
jgi:hypothetical protein